MKALIDLQVSETRVASHSSEIIDGVTKYTPVIETIENSARIAQIEETEFDVCPDALIWVDCDANVTLGTHYYDTVEQIVKNKNNDPWPG